MKKIKIKFEKKSIKKYLKFTLVLIALVFFCSMLLSRCDKQVLVVPMLNESEIVDTEPLANKRMVERKNANEQDFFEGLNMNVVTFSYLEKYVLGADQNYHGSFFSFFVDIVNGYYRLDLTRMYGDSYVSFVTGVTFDRISSLYYGVYFDYVSSDGSSFLYKGHLLVTYVFVSGSEILNHDTIIDFDIMFDFYTYYYFGLPLGSIDFGKIRDNILDIYYFGSSNGFDNGYEIGYEHGYTQGETSGYDNGYTQGDLDGYNRGIQWSLDNYNDGYNNGYHLGYFEGRQDEQTEAYANGDTNGYIRGHSEGYTSGKADGIIIGYNSAIDENKLLSNFKTLTFGIFDYPIKLVKDIFTDNNGNPIKILGIDLQGLIMFIVGISLAGYVIRWLV